jgi:hypothetical protein
MPSLKVEPKCFRKFAMPPKEESVTEFLNVDLEIRARTGLDELLRSMAPSVIVLNQSEHFASIELNEDYPSPEETVVKLIELITSLPPAARDIWNQCGWRRLDIGIQARNEPYAATFALSERTVSLIAAFKLEVVFTVYRPHT